MNDREKHSEPAKTEDYQPPDSQTPDDTVDVTTGRMVRVSGSADDRSLERQATDALRYRLLRPHAKGGLGEVFVAQDRELSREVALKEIQQHHADDPASRARFVLEAEVTGGLEHPGIVPVYGLGQYADGRPYYAMRFIRGDSLQEAVDRYHATPADSGGSAVVRAEADRGLTFRKLLGRFIDVCNAIQYAHSRGVLHRDLKPGNVMLGKYGETLVVDWGLARVQNRDDGAAGEGEQADDDEAALRPASGSQTAPTQMGSAIGTPAFMPPEQAAGRLDELGPVSDVYSLGATLYYVLTGKPAFRGKDLAAVLQQVQDGDFRSPRDVRADVPPPLSAICLRAMATSPPDRYASPQQLADDVERYLADEPVTAYAEPFRLRARRWLRKHPKSVSALAATVLVGLVSASVAAAVVSGKNAELAEKNGKLIAANIAERQATEEAVAQRNRAVAAEEVAKVNEAKARSREEDANAVLKFFEEKVLAAARPKDQGGGLGFDVTIRAAIDSAEPQIAESFAAQPLVEASIRNVLGVTYNHLDLSRAAIRQHQRARGLRESRLGHDHADTLSSMTHLAESFRKAGQLEEAVQLNQETLKLKKATLGPKHVDTLVSMNNLANAYGDAGRWKQAIALHEETLALMRDVLGAEHPLAVAALYNLASAFDNARDRKRALPLHEEAAKLFEAVHGLEHPETLNALNGLAVCYMNTRQGKRAVPILEKVLELKKSVLGPDHAATILGMQNLAGAYQQSGQVKKSLPLYKRTLELSKLHRSPNHPETLLLMSNLASAYWRTKDFDRSVPLFEDVVERMTETFGETHPHTLNAQANLSANYRDSGRMDDAIRLLQEVHRRGPVPGVFPWIRRELLKMCVQAGKKQETLTLVQETLETSRKTLPPDSGRLAGTLAFNGFLLLQVQLWEEAESILRECVRIREKVSANHWMLSNAQSLLGGALIGQKKFAEAEPLLLSGYRGLRNAVREIPRRDRPHITYALKRLVDLYTGWKKPAEAAKWKAEFDAWQAAMN